MLNDGVFIFLELEKKGEEKVRLSSFFWVRFSWSFSRGVCFYWLIYGWDGMWFKVSIVKIGECKCF